MRETGFNLSANEVNHFNSELIKKINEFIAGDPERLRLDIGIRRDTDDDYIWHRRWEWSGVEPGRPVCPVCGLKMAEGTIFNRENMTGFPYWFCFTKNCRLALRNRLEKELEDYREKGGLDDDTNMTLKRMNVPASHRNKNMNNLVFNGKNQIRKEMKNRTNLLITGGTGTGKTHLAVALLVEFGRFKPNKFRFESIPIIFVNIQSMVANNEDYAKIINDAVGYDTLVLDDLGAGKVSEHRLEVLYNIIAGRGYELRQTIITTNMMLQQIRDNFDERLASRLCEYKQVRMTMGDYRRKKEKP